MIKLYDGELMDLLKNSAFAGNVEVKCISYAMKSEIRRILDNLDNTFTSADIDKLPDKILDYLALELRSPYYDENFATTKKQDIIKNTLKWYMNAGTPSAMNELIYATFGDGSTVEWPIYGGDPGHFKVEIRDQMTPEKLNNFVKTIDRVKPARAVLDSVDVVSPARGAIIAGLLNTSYNKNIIKMEV